MSTPNPTPPAAPQNPPSAPTPSTPPPAPSTPPSTPQQTQTVTMPVENVRVSAKPLSIPDGGIYVAGTPGGIFNIRSNGGFGDKVGMVLFGGEIVPTITSWKDDCIKGTIPSHIKRGEVIVQHANGRFVGGW